MLTEPDMQARYVAATLGVIEAELRKLDLPTSNRRALFTLVASAAKAAARLADELDPPADVRIQACARAPDPADHRENVIAFQRPARNRWAPCAPIRRL